MRKVILNKLRIFDDLDAQFPLDWKRVTKLKKAIFLEFLRLRADKYVAVDLVGNAAFPQDVEDVLNLIPENIEFEWIQLTNHEITESVWIADNISVLSESVELSFSSNPVEVRQPRFLMLEDGIESEISSQFKGCVVVETSKVEEREDGEIGLVTRCMSDSEARKAGLLGNKVLATFRDPKSVVEKKVYENLRDKPLAACAFMKLMDFVGSEEN